MSANTKSIVLSVALAVGAAAGWVAAGVANSSNEATGRARCPQRANGGGLGQAALPTAQSNATARPHVAKPKRKAPIRSSSDAEVQRRALEKRVRFLEDSIRIAKEKKPPKAFDATTASNEEIVERLMKLPTEWERDKELERLGTNRYYTFTMGQLGKLCPKMYGDLSREERAGYYGRVFEKAAERLAVLESVDQSFMTDDERALHQNFAEDLSNLPGFYNEKLYHLDGSIENKTLNEVVGDIKMIVDYQTRREELLAEERKMLISQTVKHFDIPEDVAADLLTAMDDVAKATEPAVFYRKK